MLRHYDYPGSVTPADVSRSGSGRLSPCRVSQQQLPGTHTHTGNNTPRMPLSPWCCNLSSLTWWSAFQTDDWRTRKAQKRHKKASNGQQCMLPNKREENNDAIWRAHEPKHVRAGTLNPIPAACCEYRQQLRPTTPKPVHTAPCGDSKRRMCVPVAVPRTAPDHTSARRAWRRSPERRAMGRACNPPRS